MSGTRRKSLNSVQVAIQSKNPSDSQKCYLFVTENEDLVWTVTLFDGSTVIQGSIFRAQLDKLAANTSYAEEEFYSAFRSAMGLNPTDDVYSFRLADKIITNENKLSWATYIAEDKMTFQLGEINMRRVEQQETHSGIIRDMFDYLLNQTKEHENAAKKLKKQCQLEQKTAEEAVKKLDKFSKQHEQSEAILYHNFVCILNEKKQKLRELRDECEALRAGGSSAAVTVAAPPATRRGRGGKAPKRKVIVKQLPQYSSEEESQVTLPIGQPAQRLQSLTDDDDDTEVDEPEPSRVSDGNSVVGPSTQDLDELLGLEDAPQSMNKSPAKRQPVLAQDVPSTSNSRETRSTKRAAIKSTPSESSSVKAMKKCEAATMDLDDLLDGL